MSEARGGRGLGTARQRLAPLPAAGVAAIKATAADLRSWIGHGCIARPCGRLLKDAAAPKRPQVDLGNAQQQPPLGMRVPETLRVKQAAAAVTRLVNTAALTRAYVRRPVLLQCGTR